MILISACLAGVNCKYNGGNNLNEDIKKLVSEGKAILVCPEQLGGLTTPRSPSEIIDLESSRVISKEGLDVTKEFIKGAEETLKIAKNAGTNIAILKSKSPSCGYGKIYDGSFTGKLIKGNGITADLLMKNNIKVYTEEDYLDKLIKDN